MSDQVAGLPPARLERLRWGLAEHGLEAAVLFGAEAVGWATGYQRYLGGPYALVVDDSGERTLLVPAFEQEAAEEADVVDAVVPFADRTLGLNLELSRALETRLEELLSTRRVGVAGASTGCLEHVQDLSALVGHIRLCKDADELSAVRESFALALAGQRAVAEAAIAGAREIELFTLAQAEVQRKLARPAGFVCDLISGPRTGAAFGPVNVAGSRKLAGSDVVVADVAVGTAFWADSARTLIVGEADDQLLAARTAIQAVLEAVPTMLAVGTSCSAVYEQVRSAIHERLPAWEFPHHAGHGVGASVFERPHLIPTDHTPLEPGMVLAVEPGAYLPGRYGVRIEDMFIVGRDGGVPLNCSHASGAAQPSPGG